MGACFWQWSSATVQEHHFSCQSGEEKRHNIHIHWRNDTSPLHSHHAVTPRIHTLSPTSTLHLKLVLSLLYFCSFLRHRKYAQCIMVVFSSRCHGSTVCFRHSDRGLLSQLSICDDWLQGKAINLSGEWGDTLLELHNVCGYATSTAVLFYCVSSIQMSSATSFHPSLCLLLLKTHQNMPKKGAFEDTVR